MKNVIFSLIIGYTVWILIASGPPPFDIMKIATREYGGFFWGFITGISVGVAIIKATVKRMENEK